MLGVGGGVVVVPVLTLIYGLPMRYAVAVSLVAVAATSASSAGSYLRQGRVDVPLALELEVATAAGAVGAGVAAPFVPEGWLYLAFTLAVLYAAYGMLRPAAAAGPSEVPRGAEDPADRRAAGGDSAGGPGRIGGDGRGADGGSAPATRRPNRGWGVAGMTGAGVASGLLGIGGGFAKVPIMHALMGVRLPVATATSTFMIGMTAASSGWVYWARGDLSLGFAGPVALGVLAGGTAGARLSRHLPERWLRGLFVLLLLYVAGQMAWRGWTGVAG